VSQRASKGLEWRMEGKYVNVSYRYKAFEAGFVCVYVYG